MKQTITNYTFVEAFQSIRPDNFSYEGLHQLFEYLTSYEEDSGVELELDVIAICCEYTEQSYEAIANDYSIDIEGLDEDEAKQHVMNFLCDNTSVIGDSDNQANFIYQTF